VQFATLEAFMTHSQTPIVILLKTWQDAKLDAYPIRKCVFVEEQGVPEEMELDEFDLNAQHALAYAGPECIGTARLVTLSGSVGSIGRIGRMAVLPKHRGQGIGKQLLKGNIHILRRATHGPNRRETYNCPSRPTTQSAFLWQHGHSYAPD
jgi:GNAT superfamily N-acetyltransferase